MLINYPQCCALHIPLTRRCAPFSLRSRPSPLTALEWTLGGDLSPLSGLTARYGRTR